MTSKIDIESVIVEHKKRHCCLKLNSKCWRDIAIKCYYAGFEKGSDFICICSSDITKPYYEDCPIHGVTQ